LGAQIAFHNEMWNPGKPASSTLGISAQGEARLGGDRIGLDVAARTCGSAFDT